MKCCAVSPKTTSYLAVWFFCVLIVVMCSPERADARFIKRSTESSTCSSTMPCGFEIYSRVTRRTEAFVYSPCECADGTRCLRHTDDISISSYVYRCKVQQDSEETEEFN